MPHITDSQWETSKHAVGKSMMLDMADNHDDHRPLYWCCYWTKSQNWSLWCSKICKDAVQLDEPSTAWNAALVLIARVSRSLSAQEIYFRHQHIAWIVDTGLWPGLFKMPQTFWPNKLAVTCRVNFLYGSSPYENGCVFLRRSEEYESFKRLLKFPQKSITLRRIVIDCKIILPKSLKMCS